MHLIPSRIHRVARRLLRTPLFTIVAILMVVVVPKFEDIFSGLLKGQLDGIRYGNVWVFLDKGDAAPSRGRAIDHIGWRMPDLMARASDFRKQGITFTTEPQPGPPGAFSPVLMSFAEDPWGVKIELLQRRGE